MRRLDQSLIISGLLHTFFTLSDIVNYRSLLQSYNQRVQIIVTLKCAFISRNLADSQTDIQQTDRQTSDRHLADRQTDIQQTDRHTSSRHAYRQTSSRQTDRQTQFFSIHHHWEALRHDRQGTKYSLIIYDIALRLLLIYIDNIHFQKFSCERNSRNSKR